MPRYRSSRVPHLLWRHLTIPLSHLQSVPPHCPTPMHASPLSADVSTLYNLTTPPSSDHQATIEQRTRCWRLEPRHSAKGLLHDGIAASVLLAPHRHINRLSEWSGRPRGVGLSSASETTSLPPVAASWSCIVQGCSANSLICASLRCPMQGRLPHMHHVMSCHGTQWPLLDSLGLESRSYSTV